MLAAICTIASVLGGYLGYAIGAALFEIVGQPIIDFWDLDAAYTHAKQIAADQGVWIVAFFGLTVLPYKVITIASGATDLDPVAFGIASVASRGRAVFHPSPHCCGISASRSKLS